MASDLYREKSIERISSPEQLNEYLKVTKPAVWVLLLAVILLLVGFIVWGALTYIGSFVKGTAEVKDGVMIVRFEDDPFAEKIREGMTVNTEETSDIITSIGRDGNGDIFAMADTKLKDGTYEVSVRYKTTQILSLLFGN